MSLHGTSASLPAHGKKPCPSDSPPLPGADSNNPSQDEKSRTVDGSLPSQGRIFEIEPPGDPPDLFPSVDHEDASMDEVPRREGCLPEIGPDLACGVVTIDDRTHTAKILVYSGVGICSHYRCVALLDTGSPQTFILESAWQRMVLSGAADERFARHTTPRTW